METHADLSALNQTQLEAFAGAFEADAPPSFMLVQYDQPVIREAMLEQVVDRVPDYQHIVLDLHQEQVTSLAALLEEKLPEAILAAEATEHIIHILDAELSFFKEILEGEPVWIPALDEEWKKLSEAYAYIPVLWLDSHGVELITAKAPAFLQQMGHRFSFQGESSPGQTVDNPYLKLAQWRDQLTTTDKPGVQGEICLGIAELFANHSRHSDASIYYERVLEYCQLEPSPVLLAKSQMGIGTLQMRENDFQQAVDSFEAVLEILAEQNLPAETGEIHRKLGIIYQQIRNTDLALVHFQASNTAFATTEAYQKVGDNYSGIASILERKGNIDKTIGMHQRAIEAYTQADLPADLAKSWQHIGAIYQNQLEWAAALDAFQQALDFAKKVKDDFLIAALEDSVEQMEEKGGKGGARPASQASKPDKQSDRRGFFRKLFGGGS